MAQRAGADHVCPVDRSCLRPRSALERCRRRVGTCLWKGRQGHVFEAPGQGHAIVVGSSCMQAILIIDDLGPVRNSLDVIARGASRVRERVEEVINRARTSIH